MRPKNSHRKSPALGVTRLEDRTVPASTITVTAGANGSGSLDGFLFDATPGVITAADGGNNPGTLSTGALAAVAATVDINVAAQNGIHVNDLGGTLTLQTGAGHSVTFNASGGALTAANAANMLATSGASLNLSAAAGLSVFNLSAGGGVTLTAGGAGNLVARSILTGGVGPVLVQMASGGTGSISQSGNVFGGAVSFSGHGNVSLDAVRGSSVSIITTGGSVSSAGGNAIQSTGLLTLQATSGITVNTLAASIQAINGVSGNISITQAALPAQPLTTAGAGVQNTVAGGSITIMNLGNALTVAAGALVQSLNGPITLAAQDLIIANTVNSGTARTTLANSTAGRPIDLGTNTAGKLGLTPAELNNVTAGVLQVGSVTAGVMTASATIGPLSGSNVLALVNNDVINETSTGRLNVPNLRISSAQPALAMPNTVGTLAATATGGLVFDNNAPLIVGTVDGVSGITAGQASLFADNLDVQQPINAGTNLLQIAPLTVTRPISVGSEVASQLSLTDAELGRMTAGVVRLGSASGGAITVNAGITRHAGYGALSLLTAGTVGQTAPLSVANLAVQSGGTVTLSNAGNDVDTLAARVTGAQNDLIFNDANGLAIGVVDGVSGIVTADATTLSTGGPIADGNGPAANVTAATLTVSAGGGADMDVDVPQILNFSAGGPITLSAAGNANVSGLNAVGGTITLDGGNFIQAAAKAIPAANSLVIAGANFNLNFNTSFAGVQLAGGSITGSGTLSSAAGFDVRSGSISAALGGGVGLTKSTAGTLTLAGVNTYTGPTTIIGGTLLVNGSLPAGGSVTVNGGTLGGSGSVGPVTATAGAIAPGSSPGLLTANGNVSFGPSAAFVAEVNGATAGTQYDQLKVVGTVSLGGASLTVSVGGGFVPSVGTQFVLIDNDGTDSVAGTFNALAEGASILVAGQRFTISYAGGTGNDVVLTKAPVALQSVTVDDGTAQRSLVRSITVTFGGLAAFAGLPSNAFQLSRTGPGGPTGLVTLAVDTSGSTATQTVARLTFTGPMTEGANSLIDGNYTLTVLGGQVVGGVQGGDSVTGLSRLFGDVNGDKAVNGLDLTAWRGAFGTTSTDARFTASLDFNGDRVINGTDLTQFRTRFGVILP